jgi:hypothetical protein
VMFVVLLVGILQGVERPGSVYSMMPQWWHLMVLQYVAASFHLPSVSTSNINTVQYTKPYSDMKYQQSQLLWYPRCCFLSPTLWQRLSTVTAASNLMSVQACQHKTIILSHNTILFSTAADPAQTRAQCVQLPKYINKF